MLEGTIGLKDNPADQDFDSDTRDSEEERHEHHEGGGAQSLSGNMQVIYMLIKGLAMVVKL